MARSIPITVLLCWFIFLNSVSDCEAQQRTVWTQKNIQTWIDSDRQKHQKRDLLRSLNPHERKEYSNPAWFVPPEMFVNTSKVGELGRLIFPAYKIIQILDESHAIIEVTDQKGHRYMIVFDLGDTRKLKVDHIAHISPEKFSLILFERTDNFLYRDSQNIRRSLPAFKKLNPIKLTEDLGK